MAAPKDKAVLSQKLTLLRAKVAEMEAQHEVRLAEVRARNEAAHSALQQLSDKFAAQHEGYGRVSDDVSEQSLHETSTDSAPTLHDRDVKFDSRRASEASTVEPSEASDEDMVHEEFAVLRRSSSASLLSAPEEVEPSPLPLDTPSPEWPQSRVPCGAFMGMGMGMGMPCVMVPV